MHVTITSPFWTARREQIADRVIPYQWGVINDDIDVTTPDDPAGNQLSDSQSHAVANLKVAAGDIDDIFRGMVFQDSDVYKWLEEAAYALSYTDDPKLRELWTSSPVHNPTTAISTPHTRSAAANGRTASASACCSRATNST